MDNTSNPKFKPVLLTPRISRTLFMRALQYYFSDHPEYKWDPDRSKTQIFIQDEIAEDARHDSIIPTIVIENTGYNFSDDSIGSNLAHVERHREYLHLSEHQYVVNGGINIHCLSQSSIDSEELAFEISFFILSLRWQLHTMFNMQKMSTPSQSKATGIQREGWYYHYNSVVSFSYSIAVRSKLTPVDNGPLLRDLMASIHINKDDGWLTRQLMISNMEGSPPNP